MAGKNNRSSKTAHVLNLLSGGAPETKEEPVPAVQKASPAAPSEPESPAPNISKAEPPVPAARHLSPPILEVARSSNAALSESIHTALESALEEELAASAQAAAPVPPPPAVPDSVTEPEASSPEPAPEVPVSAAPSALPEPEPPEPEDAGPKNTEPEDSPELLNVMQILVEEKLERYVKLFGLCSCPRCLADTKALALTRLPAQYAVLPPEVKIPRLSLYRAKYDSAVTTQIIYACKAVMDSPRHTPPAGTP